jgi:hypothetical protein
MSDANLRNALDSVTRRRSRSCSTSSGAAPASPASSVVSCPSSVNVFNQVSFAIANRCVDELSTSCANNIDRLIRSFGMSGGLHRFQSTHFFPIYNDRNLAEPVLGEKTPEMENMGSGML